MITDPISLEELGLLDVLVRIDQGVGPEPTSQPLRERLTEAGLVEFDGSSGLRLTEAGIERCKALHHRVSADAEAEHVLAGREESEAGGHSSNARA